jgi:aminomethyltransferase
MTSVFLDKSQTVPISLNRFDKGPYFDFYHKENNSYGIYAGRYFATSVGNDIENTYWNLRRKAVMYDVPEKPIQIEGPQAPEFLDKVFTRKISDMKIGRGRYAIACYEDGGIFIDGVMFRLDENKFWYVQPDGPLETWLKAHQKNFDIKITDPSSRVIQIQGPLSKEILSKLTNGSINDELKYYHSGFYKISNQDVYISRTGWTSEMGYEIYTLGKKTNYKNIWDSIIEIGAPLGLIFDGLESMDVRRIEAGILDNNTDFDSSINPYEAGLGSLVDLSREDFIGKKSLEIASKKQGKKLFGITSDNLIAHRSKVFLSNGQEVGYLTAATWSPTLKKYVGYVRFDYSGSWIDFGVKVQSQEQLVDCEIIELPFFDKKKLIPKGIDKKIP